MADREVLRGSSKTNKGQEGGRKLSIRISQNDVPNKISVLKQGRTNYIIPY